MKYFVLSAAARWPRMLALSCLLGLPASLSAQEVKKYNVLFFYVDDLRPELKSYGVEHMSTPNIDKLAGSAVQFQQAHCQQAVCTPSRASMLTGTRPDVTKVYDIHKYFRTTPALANVVTLPQIFTNNGYTTVRVGKVFHQEDDQSWNGKAASLADPAGKVVDDGNAIQVVDKPDNLFKDGITASKAVATLAQLKDGGKPFFLAVGMSRPHLPFVVPQKHWGKYPNVLLPPADYVQLPKDIPSIALGGSGLQEFRGYNDMESQPQGPFTGNVAKDLRRAYFAAISHTDEQIGRVINELDRLNLRENTIIVLVADHGFKLGELGQWGKFTNFELDTRVPLIMDVPGAPGNQKRRQQVELLDLYPTLCDLTGLTKPAHLQGTSFKHLFVTNTTAAAKPAVFSQFPRWQDDRKINIMGYSMRTPRYRFTRWQEQPNPSVVIARELYDHETDPLEKKNIIGTADPNLVKQLDQQLTDALKVQAAEAAKISTAARGAAPQPSRAADDAEAETTLAVFPNPSEGIFHVQLDPQTWTGASVRVVDGIGRTVRQLTYQGQEWLPLDLSQQKAGLYQLRVEKGPRVKTQALQKH
ncbi:sulfatase-like hydrolase/transferase [Hymenobacter weizhouensis]|uniref:sulfatase-like hydrolase/transferase n=1 Tax=Hymenobacter sp. YIM 151500-1 TaxID=2987689 RepID=UPI0022270F47|nr:sulfatase-like hydrolase/transferase [Hymenobacter sp. YIM 151500-1]UYZ63512.1 sulfatase-like hydrolase/transferase [Hymenobacter sp. YIM 151500-1]